MTYLEKLLMGVNVEWKTLGEVVEIIRGVRITKNDLLTDGKFPVVSGGIGFMGYTNNYNRESDTITIAQYGTAGYVKWQTEKFWANDVCFCVKPNKAIILNRYLYFYLINKQQYIYDISNRTATPYSIERDKILKLEISIPPLEIQKEIVAILDTLTENTTVLKAELTTELTVRKKQYEYYKEKLLTFEDGAVEWKALGELFEFKNGINKEKEFFGKGDLIINYTDVFKNNKLYEENIYGKVEANKSDVERFNCKKGDVFFTRTSETKNEIGYASVLLSDILICVFSGFLIRARPITNLLLPEYCGYCFTSDKIRSKIISSSNMTTRVTTTGTILSKIKIPIPSLQEQKRIVSILDKFDTLTASISEGLPKEIELRKKQYEYYRDMLLSFPK